IDEGTEIDSGSSRREFGREFQLAGLCSCGRARHEAVRPELPGPSRRLWRSPVGMSAARLSILVMALMLVVSACSTTRPGQAPQPADRGAPSPRAARPPSGPSMVKDGDVFESRDFVVTLAKSGDTPETLAARHLG